MRTMKRGYERISMFLITIVFLLAIAGAAHTAPGDIFTLAGGGAGDGGTAISANLSNPHGVTIDGSGNIYIVDSYNNRIRKVDIIGIITTVAGNGSWGYSGDGGPAISASLSGPNGVTIDSSGNIYIADTSNHRIRKVDTSGIITTVAGNGTIGYSGGYSGDGGPATSANLANPTDVTIDASGNIYIADSGNHRIRKVDTLGIINTVAGNGTIGYLGDGGPATSASISYPKGVVINSLGNIYITDTGNNVIRKVEASGVISTVAGNGTIGYSGDGGIATSARLYYPSSVAIDGSGNIYIADSGNNRIRKVDPAGIITTVAGNGNGVYSGDGSSAISAGLYYPKGVVVDTSGNMYIADKDNNRIRKVDPAGIITTIAGNGTVAYSGDGGTAISASLSSPKGIAVDGLGNTYIADTNNHRIRKVDPAGIISTVAGNGTYGNSGDGGPAISANLNSPFGVAIDGLGNIYIADSGNNHIRKVDTSGIITTIASGSSGGLTVDSSGNIYIAHSDSRSVIHKVDSAGIFTTVAGNGTVGYSGDGGPATSASLNLPADVTIDTSGNMYIADTFNQRIRKVDTLGIITTIAGNGIYGYSGDGGPATSARLNYPNGVTVDSSGNIYIVDYYNQRIRKVNTSGIITTVVGNGEVGYSGDGGPAISATLYSPSDVTVDVLGNIYIADSSNNRIRKVEGPIYALNITKSGVGNGTITSSPTGINCGTVCSVDYGSGTTVILTPTPDTGFAFAGWSGDADCSDGVVTMNADKTCTAVFTPDTTPPTGTININTDNPWTNTTSVTLTLTCTDDAGCSNMQITNDGVFDTEPWEIFIINKEWQLTTGDGSKTVSIHYQDSVGNISTTYTDNIILDTTRPVVSGVSDTPDPFNPSIGEVSRINFTLSDNLSGMCRTVVRVLTQTGSLVRNIIKNTSCPPAGVVIENFIIWDGRDSTGNIVPAGTYNYNIISIDRAMNRSIVWRGTTTVR